MRRTNLISRIPDDVLKRARKAGAEHVDWYAGRLQGGMASCTASTDHKETLARYKKQRGSFWFRLLHH